jgi:hypothetical protein
MKKIIALCSLSFLVACGSVSIPAKGSTSDGAEWSGYFTIDNFEIAGGGTICTGKPPMGFAKIQTAEFTCNDGRTGVVTTTRGWKGGTAAVTFSDGMTGKFTYGK